MQVVDQGVVPDESFNRASTWARSTVGLAQVVNDIPM